MLPFGELSAYEKGWFDKMLPEPYPSTLTLTLNPHPHPHPTRHLKPALTLTLTLTPTLTLTLTRFDKMLPELKAQIKKGEEYANQ